MTNKTYSSVVVALPQITLFWQCNYQQSCPQSRPQVWLPDVIADSGKHINGSITTCMMNLAEMLSTAEALPVFSAHTTCNSSSHSIGSSPSSDIVQSCVRTFGLIWSLWLDNSVQHSIHLASTSCLSVRHFLSLLRRLHVIFICWGCIISFTIWYATFVLLSLIKPLSWQHLFCIHASLASFIPFLIFMFTSLYTSSPNVFLTCFSVYHWSHSCSVSSVIHGWILHCCMHNIPFDASVKMDENSLVFTSRSHFLSSRVAHLPPAVTWKVLCVVKSFSLSTLNFFLMWECFFTLYLA